VPVTDGHCATADLAIVKTAAPEPVQAGATLTYTLAVNNLGPSAATNVKVTDTIPAGTTLVSATGTGWTCGNVGSAVTCTFPSLAFGANTTITISVTAPATAGSISNTATVSADQYDPVTTNNSSTATSTVAKCGDSVVQSGEQCDDGAGNGTATDCCSATCQFQPATTVCHTATDACDQATLCTGAAAACPADQKQPNGTVCPGSTTCNAQWTCQGGTCTAGAPISCDDSNACTSDSCDPTADAANGCTHTNLGNGTACPGGTCDGNGNCVATPDAGIDSGADSGVDSGAVDSGVDSGAVDSGIDSGVDSGDVDSGGNPVDAAPGIDAPGPTDGATGSDAAGNGDSGPKRDSGAPSDAASDADSGTEGGNPGDNGGCGCRTAGSSGGNGMTGAAAVPLLAFPLLLVARRRRRRLR
jgi:uncharacterized repeat protein (TIGR01451 family)